MPVESFLDQQKKFDRVKAALAEKSDDLIQNLKSHNLTADNLHILMVAYKDEDELEIYGKNKSADVYSKLTSYQICAKSGTVGPKWKQGDGQVPEGFYHIDRFNPVSNFHLSLGINYPNEADRKRSTAAHLGGDIFIHGSCVTIGCLPMTDDKIKEIYLYSVYAKNNGQHEIPVYIFPFRMTDQNMLKYKTAYGDQAELVRFWASLKRGYDKFVLEKKQLNQSTDLIGGYKF